MKKPNMIQARIRTNQIVPIVEYRNCFEKIGLNKKYFIKTYGCQMNEHDTENIKAILEEIGFNETNNIEQADLILLNTCSIRENAHNKVFGMLGRLKKIKEKNNVLVGLCGCMAQEEMVVEKIIAKYKWLDFVFGTHNIVDLPKLIKEKEMSVYSKEGEVYENIPIKREFKHKAWVNVMYGCDKFCTYCIVPYTRGKQRSRKKEYIINEVKELVKDNCQEITLLGQNVNAYGKDLKDNYYLADLLKDLAKLKIARIRFITSHPWDFSDEMIEVIKNNPNIMPHIHLPIQSGSDKILKRMGRRYNVKTYFDLFKKLKKEINDIAITTDIIVGFPNETEDDFQKTLDIVNKCQFDYAFTFVFSKRNGTPAADFEDKISLEEKKERLKKLNQLVNHYTLKSNQKEKNKIVNVLVDGFSEKNKTMLTGYTERMKRINFKGDQSLIGKIIKVKVTKIKTWSLEGDAC